MIKKILLVLDPSKEGLAARHYAMDFATQHECLLTAISILDTPWITAGQPEPLGGSVFKVQRDDTLIAQSHEQIKKLMYDFKTEAKKRNISVKCFEGEGFPSTVIEHLSHENDLIIIGRTTDIHFSMEEASDLVMRHVARDNPRPVLVVPSYMTEKNSFLVAQDGSHEAARALHMLLLLGLAKDTPLDIITIHPDLETAQDIANRSVRMCQTHHVKATAYGVLEKKPASDHILEHIETHQNNLLCLGGFSHSALKEALFGSTTSRILKKTKIPLFIHH